MFPLIRTEVVQLSSGVLLHLFRPLSLSMEVLLLCVWSIFNKVIKVFHLNYAEEEKSRSSFKVWVISCVRVFTLVSFFWVECHCCDGFIALDPSAGQVRGATARLMSVAGNWQMEASISPLIRGSSSPPTDRVQLGNVVPASSHPVRFIKRSLIPRHNIINFVSGWTQWTSNLINFYHWMLEGRLNEINAQYFPGRQPTLGVGLDCWQVRRCRRFGQLCLV